MPVGAAQSMSDAVRPSMLFSFSRLGRHDARAADCGEVLDVEGKPEVMGEQDFEHTVDEDDVAPRRVLVSPQQPTQSEIDEHMIDHIPFRSWCKCCLEGSGREASHFRLDGERSVPLIAFDYLFITSLGVVLRKDLGAGEEENPDVLKVLAVRDPSSKALAAFWCSPERN